MPVLAYLCSSESWGGLEMNHLRNAHWMHLRGHNVIYFCVEGSRTHEQAIEMGLPIQLIAKHRKYYDFKKGRALVRLLTINNVSHLIVRSTFDLSILAFAKSKLKSKLHTSYFMEMQLGVAKRNVLHTLRYRKIDLWSCPLNWLANQVQELTHFRNKLVVIPSGLELDRFRNQDKITARKHLELDPNRTLIGLAGRFDRQKGQLLLLKAISKCQASNFHVVLLGEPTLNEDGSAYHSEMLEVIAQNDLSDRVFFRPFMPNIEVFYSSLDWFVMATKAETFGMVTIEAMASGVPVIGSNAGGTPEILGEGKFGILFQPEDVEDLANKLTSAVRNERRFDSEDLILEAQKYDHHLICKSIEHELGLINR